MTNHYPEILYQSDGRGLGRVEKDRRAARQLEHGYDIGLTEGAKEYQKILENNALAGWANLTKAIADGKPIDWEKLYGLEAKCVHPELGTLTHKMTRNINADGDLCRGWFDLTVGKGLSVWNFAIELCWGGRYGWTLYVRGTIPMKRMTADQLKPGTCFQGRCSEGNQVLNGAMLLFEDATGKRIVQVAFTDIILDPEEVEVVKDHGIGKFQKTA